MKTTNTKEARSAVVKGVMGIVYIAGVTAVLIGSAIKQRKLQRKIEQDGKEILELLMGMSEEES